MPLSQVKYYYGKVKNVSEQLATVQPPMPSECKKKALNVLGCSYVFCSSDKTALLFKTSRSDCEGIGKWYVTTKLLSISKVSYLKPVFH